MFESQITLLPNDCDSLSMLRKSSPKMGLLEGQSTLGYVVYI